ncbi:MAG: hypothetical protein WCJ03_10490 [Bacteroidales bacterium]
MIIYQKSLSRWGERLSDILLSMFNYIPFSLAFVHHDDHTD